MKVLIYLYSCHCERSEAISQPQGTLAVKTENRHGAGFHSRVGRINIPLVYSSAHLFFPDFIECLAIDALGRCGSRFQTTDADLDPARITIAVLIAIEHKQ